MSAVACTRLYSDTRSFTHRFIIFLKESLEAVSELKDKTLLNDCIMSSIILLTVHGHIPTALASPAELVTWKVLGGA